MASKNPQAQAISNNMVFIRDNVAVSGLSTVAGYLLQEGLIAQQNFDDALAACGKGPHDQAIKLLRPVEEKIKGDPNKFFPKFIVALRSSDLGFVADKLEQAVKEVRIPSDPKPVPDLPTPTDERPKYPMEQIHNMSTTYAPLPVPSDASQREEIKKFAANQINVIIQSCNNAEYYAALEKMEAATDIFDKPVKYPTGKYTIVVGTFAGNNAAIVRTGQGNKCREDLKEILGYFPNAKYLFGLGVCMGIKGKFGDVLIGKMVQIEQNLKLENGKLVLRGTREVATQTMRNIFCDDTTGWKGFECIATAEGGTSEPRISLVFSGCILSSPTLLNDSNIKQGLEKESQTLIGAEMEGWVLFTDFKNIESIIIKGISDYGDGTKADDWQLTAAKAAADYAHFKLKNSYLD